MKLIERSIEVEPEVRVTAVWAVPPGFRSGGAAVVLAHGAGNDMRSPFLSAMHIGMAERGLLSVKFNFLYTEQGRKAPDRMPRLESTWRAVLAHLRADPELAPGPVFIGGKSMGGRVASHLAASGISCAGLLFLGYPLHPAGKPAQLRDDHLYQIRCRMLFVEGTRDPLCRLDLLEPVLERLGPRAQLHLIDGGDHSFRTLKRQGRSEQQVWQEILQASADWMAAA